MTESAIEEIDSLREQLDAANRRLSEYYEAARAALRAVHRGAIELCRYADHDVGALAELELTRRDLCKVLGEPCAKGVGV